MGQRKWWTSSAIIALAIVVLAIIALAVQPALAQPPPTDVPPPAEPVPSEAPPPTTAQPGWQMPAPPPSVLDCRAACVEEGRCAAEGSSCVVVSENDCRRSIVCRRHGWCSLTAGRCGTLHDFECSMSEACQLYGACRAGGGRCVTQPLPIGSAARATKERSTPARNTGISFVAAGGVTAIVGMAVLLADERDTTAQLIAGTNLLPVAGALIVMGVPFWALGATEIPADAELRSEGMMIAGTVLAGLGAGGITVSAFFVAVDVKEALAPLSIGAAALLAGATIAGYGATIVLPGEQNAKLDLSLGASGLELRGRF